MEGAARAPRRRVVESTPGRRRALKALAAAKRRNKAAVLRGEKPVIAGKAVPIKRYVRKYGKPKQTEATGVALDIEVGEDDVADIFDAEDVAVAVDLLRDEDEDDLRSYVVERATELGHADLIPEDWMPSPKIAESPDLLPEFDDDDLAALDDEDVEVVEEYASELDVLTEAEDESAKAAPSARIAAQKADPKKAPKYIFGKLNKAYRKDATDEDVAGELGAIRARGKAKGFAAKDQAVLGTYAKNLERKIKAGIIARAVAKYGKQPSPAAVQATYEKYGKATVDSLVARASKALGAASKAAGKSAEAPGQQPTKSPGKRWDPKSKQWVDKEAAPAAKETTPAKSETAPATKKTTPRAKAAAKPTAPAPARTPTRGERRRAKQRVKAVTAAKERRLIARRRAGGTGMVTESRLLEHPGNHDQRVHSPTGRAAMARERGEGRPAAKQDNDPKAGGTYAVAGGRGKDAEFYVKGKKVSAAQYLKHNAKERSSKAERKADREVAGDELAQRLSKLAKQGDEREVFRAKAKAEVAAFLKSKEVSPAAKKGLLSRLKAKLGRYQQNRAIKKIAHGQLKAEHKAMQAQSAKDKKDIASFFKAEQERRLRGG